jgi:protein-disulfide isomerase
VIERTLEAEGERYDLATDDDPSLGSPDATLTIVEFADFGCPYSREVSYAIRRLASVYENDLRYVYRDFPLEDLHPQALVAAEAGECADAQDRFWAFHDQLYQHQSDLSREALVAYAAGVGLDVDLFESCLDSGRYVAEVQADFAEGAAAGVYGTPTFFVNGVRIPGAIPEDVLEKIILPYVES